MGWNFKILTYGQILTQIGHCESAQTHIVIGMIQDEKSRWDSTNIDTDYKIHGKIPRFFLGLIRE